MSSEDPAAGGEPAGDGASGGGSAGSTTAGAALLMASPWLTAAAATAYATTAMWAKLREMGIFKSLRGRKAAAAAAAAVAAAAEGAAAGDVATNVEDYSSLELIQDAAANNGVLLQDLELQQRGEGLGPDRPLQMSPIDF